MSDFQGLPPAPQSHTRLKKAFVVLLSFVVLYFGGWLLLAKPLREHFVKDHTEWHAVREFFAQQAEANAKKQQEKQSQAPVTLPAPPPVAPKK